MSGKGMELPIAWLFGLLIFLGWGIFKLEWEVQFQKEQERLRYQGLTLNKNLRDQLGQGATIATLAGMRALVANYYWLGVTDAWERTDWYKVKSLVELVTTLQPRCLLFWDIGAWHLAWNAALDCRRNSKQPSELLRRRDENYWIGQGEALLQRGLINNPEKMDLWWKLGVLYEQRLHDHLKAAHYYLEACQRPHPPQYLERFVGYELEAGEDWASAYEWWKKLWFSTSDRSQKYKSWDVVESHLRKLELKLEIPLQERVFKRPLKERER